MRAAIARVTRNLRNSFARNSGAASILLERLPSPLVDFKTNPVDQHDQRKIVCFRHADNTSHLKLPLIERVLKHILGICGDVELRIGVETQTSNMRRVNATRNNVLDLKEMRMVSTNHPPRTSPRRHQFGLSLIHI